MLGDGSWIHTRVVWVDAWTYCRGKRWLGCLLEWFFPVQERELGDRSLVNRISCLDLGYSDESILAWVSLQDLSQWPVTGKCPVLLYDDNVTWHEVRLWSLPLGPSLQRLQVLSAPSVPKMLQDCLAQMPLLQLTGLLGESWVFRVCSRRFQQEEMTWCEGSESIRVVTRHSCEWSGVQTGFHLCGDCGQFFIVQYLRANHSLEVILHLLDCRFPESTEVW